MEGMTVKADMDRISGSQRMPLMSYEEFTKLTSAGNRGSFFNCTEL